MYENFESQQWKRNSVANSLINSAHKFETKKKKKIEGEKYKEI